MRTTDVSDLQLITLGGLDIRLCGQPAPKLMSRKVEALLIYLAANPYPHPREVLSEFFWNNQPQDRSLTYLRTALANLNKHLSPFLEITRQTIAIKSDSLYSLDISSLRTALDLADQWISLHQRFSVSAAATLEESLSQYHGRFLQGFTLRDAPGVVDWIESENTRLNAHLLQAYHGLGEYALTHGAINMGILHLQRALELDPLDEESHRLLIRLHYQSGNRSAAITQYEICRRLLETELNLDLSPETALLYQEIYAQRSIPVIARPIINTVPIPATAFVERPGVQIALEELINNPECRLLTLTGLGGVGKTRLAIEVARRHELQYTDGVLYASLVALHYDDEIPNLLVNALKLPFSENRTPEQGLLQYLREKHLMLVLDNFEHSPGSALMLSRLLAQAPHVKIIVTARQRLNLQEEWVYHVLPFPLPAFDAPHADKSEAVQLFIQTARRQDFNYQIELEWVTRICQLVEGLPLAIELAASWARVLSAEKTARKISSNIDFLSSPAHNVEERHRSIRAVFNSSWNMFDPVEREAFRKLSVFRAGFTEAAARYVADADLSTLLSLVNKSVIHIADGRYTIHELLRQYAYERLADEPTILDSVLDRHANYYADLFERYGKLLIDDPQDPIYIEVMNQSQDYFLAWKRLFARNDVVAASRLLKPFSRLFDTQNRYIEGEHFFKAAVAWFEVQEIPVDPLIVARAKILQALLGGIVNLYREADRIAQDVLPIFIECNSHWDMQVAYRCLAGSAYARGQFQDARNYFEKAQTFLEKLNEPVVLSAVMLRLSDIAVVFGEYSRAVRYLDEYLHDFRRPTFKIIYVRFLTTLGDLHIKLGNFSEAENYLLEAQQLCQILDNRIGQSVVNSTLGRVRIAQQRFTEAMQLFEQSVQLCETLQHDWGKAFALIYLGQVKTLQNDAHTAIQYLQYAHEIALHLNAHWVSTMAKRYLCGAYLQLGKFPEAQAELLAALMEAEELGVMPVTLEVLLSWAVLDASQGQVEQAREIASLIVNHPFSEYSTRNAASQLLNQLKLASVELSP